MENYDWLLYFLVFFFGYTTCKTFYFFRALRLGLVTLQICHVLGLYTIVKSLENYYFTRSMKIQELKKRNESEQVINAYKENFDKEINDYKNKCINEIIKIHPDYFRGIINYNDWNSAMRFLNGEGAEFIKKFHNK